jgi:hypothetical protein
MWERRTSPSTAWRIDDAATKVMGAAFDAACKALHDTGQPQVVQDVIAQRIIAAARTVQRNVNRLRDAALKPLPERNRAVDE